MREKDETPMEDWEIEEAKREACEQFEAEQEVMRELWEEEQSDHSARSCFCTRHWG